MSSTPNLTEPAADPRAQGIALPAAQAAGTSPPSLPVPPPPWSGTERHPWLAALARLDLFSIAVLLAGLLYVALAWTPSSYGLALAAIGLPNEGLVAGTPKPVRSDEWVVWTPYVQIAVENGFQRYADGSVYGEDLRNFNGLPLLDWALPFKPQFWGFFVADPAYAFSFSHALFIVLFLVGYHRLLMGFGLPRSWSAAGSLLLFFTSYAQLWWTTTGSLLAVFPWLLMLAIQERGWLARGPVRFAAMAWLVPVWLLSHLYPPIVVPLAFAGGMLLLAFRPQALKPRTLVPGLAGAAVGLALVYLYLAEPIRVMSQTVYPGARSIGGGQVPWPLYLAQFFPFLAGNDRFQDLLNLNICEVATGGSYLILLVVIFLDYGRLAPLLRSEAPARRALLCRVGLPLAGFLLFSLWMLVPLPAVVGKLLLWDKVPGNRMVFAAGLLLHVAALVLMRQVGVRLTSGRFATAAGGVLVAWLAMKNGLPAAEGLRRNLADLMVLPPLVLLILANWWAVRRGALSAVAGPALAAFGLILCALLPNAIGFGRFNPIQSAAPIFHRPQTPFLAELNQRAAQHPEGWLVMPGHLPGAILPGLGYRTPAHVLIAPALGFFRPYFPDLDEQTFSTLFNRYAHIQMVEGITTPRSPQPDVVQVPWERFLGPRRTLAGSR